MADGINVNGFIQRQWLDSGSGQGTYIFDEERKANAAFMDSHPSSRLSIANENKILDRMEKQFGDIAGLFDDPENLSAKEAKWVASLDKKMGTEGADPDSISMQDLDILQAMKEEGMLPQQQNQGPGTMPAKWHPSPTFNHPD